MTDTSGAGDKGARVEVKPGRMARLWAYLWAKFVALFSELFSCFDSGGSPNRNKRLLEHFVSQIADALLFAKYPPSTDTKSDNAPIADKANAFLDDCRLQLTPERIDEVTLARCWDFAYEIERLIAYLRPRDALAIEADRRVDEAKRMGLASADKFRALLDAVAGRIVTAKAALTAAQAARANATAENKTQLESIEKQTEDNLNKAQEAGDNDRRAILASTLSDLHWQNRKNIAVRAAIWASASNVRCFGFITLFIVGFPFICFVLEKWFCIRWFSNLMEMFPNYGLYTAMSFGLLGAFFSRLITFKFGGELTLEEAENRFSMSSLLIRGMVGSFGALLFYFLMRTGMLGPIGPVFENFAYKVLDVNSVLGPAEVLIPSKDWSLLALWSFAAGFSEKLVSESLAKVEATVSSQKP